MKTINEYFSRIGYLISALLIVYLLNPFNKGFLFGYSLIAFLYIFKKKNITSNLDGDFVLLLVFSLIYATFYTLDPAAGVQFIFIYALFPSGFYLLGKYLVQVNNAPKSIFLILLVLSGIFSISAIISVIINLREGGFTQIDRTIPMFWDGAPISATLMGSFLTLNMCIPAILISSYKKNKLIVNLSAIVLFLFSLTCVIRLGSRTQLVIFFFTCIISLFYIFPKQSRKENTMLLVILSIIVVIILNNVSFDLKEDWLTTFAGRMEGGTGEIASGGGRTERWVKSFEYLFSHPLGWDEKEFGFSHNMWLDVLRAGGVIPFVLLTIYSIKSFFQIKKTIRLKPENLFLNNQFLIYAIAFLLIFMVEPIFDGVFPLFTFFCLYKGIINKYYVIHSS